MSDKTHSITDPTDQAEALAVSTHGTTSGPWWCRRPKPTYPIPTSCRRVFIPCFGWLDADDEHRQRVNHCFEWPMFVLSLLVLPLLLIELLAWQQNYTYVGQHIVEHAVTVRAIEVAWVLIYVAFLAEFMAKIVIAKSRVQYLIKNWLDVVILLLPFLRAFRGIRALRAVKVAQMSRVMTLRGVGMKLFKTALGMAMGLRLVQRIKSQHTAKAKADIEHDYKLWSRSALIAEIKRLQAQLGQSKDSNSSGGP